MSLRDRQLRREDSNLRPVDPSRLLYPLSYVSWR
jgi:hypothetical protein